MIYIFLYHFLKEPLYSVIKGLVSLGNGTVNNDSVCGEQNNLSPCVNTSSKVNPEFSVLHNMITGVQLIF